MDTMWSVTLGYNVECHSWIQCGVSPMDTMWSVIHGYNVECHPNVVSSTGVSQRELLYHQRAPSFHATRTDYRMLQPFLNTALTPLSSVDGCSSFLNTLFVSLKGTPNTTDEFAIDTISNLQCSSAINCHFGK